MAKYIDLLNIVDQLRFEAPITNKRYNPDEANVEQVSQARSRAYIHLFLKVKFGLTDFDSREDIITDGPSDGGIDAYYIDRENRAIYLIQSKFNLVRIV